MFYRDTPQLLPRYPPTFTEIPPNFFLHFLHKGWGSKSWMTAPMRTPRTCSLLSPPKNWCNFFLNPPTEDNLVQPRRFFSIGCLRMTRERPKNTPLFGIISIWGNTKKTPENLQTLDNIGFLGFTVIYKSTTQVQIVNKYPKSTVQGHIQVPHTTCHKSCISPQIFACLPPV